MRSPLGDLQQAVFARLAASGRLKVIDRQGPDEPFPYLTVGESTAVERSAKNRDGTECTATVHVWSRYPGMKELHELMDEAVQALTTEPLTVAGQQTVILTLDFENTLRDPDGITRHGVVRLRATLMES